MVSKKKGHDDTQWENKSKMTRVERNKSITLTLFFFSFWFLEKGVIIGERKIVWIEKK